ncbi:MAG: major capsid protein P2 [Zoogloeaceae bacterium]|jgi:hypothetical protein|nr:major capsid protein P2 [Zoogloeaceae bacterium]
MSLGTLVREGLPFSNVVGTGVATSTITPGRSIETFRMKISGTDTGGGQNPVVKGFTPEHIRLFRLKANGKVIIEASGAEIQTLQKYRGQPVSEKFLDIDFTDESMNSRFDREVTNFDTSYGIANLTTEVHIEGANAPVIKPILIESAQKKNSDGTYSNWAALFLKILRYPYSQANGGRLPFQVPFGAQSGAIIKRLHVFHGGNLEFLTLKQDGLVLFEQSAEENEYRQVKAGRVPQENVFTVDFVVDGSIAEVLNTKDARSLEWLIDFGAADNGTVIVEYVDTLGNL